jgi:hypothetical protein
MALPGGYRGGARTNTLGSWADINVLVPGTQGDLVRGPRSPQSARSDVGWAANATPMANTAAAVSITFRRYIPQASLQLDLMRRAGRHRIPQGGVRRAGRHRIPQGGVRRAGRHCIPQGGVRRAGRHCIPQGGVRRAGRHRIPQGGVRRAGRHRIPQGRVRRAGRHCIRECKSGTGYHAACNQSD